MNKNIVFEREYVSPESECIKINLENVICASGGETPDTDEGGEIPGE
ncbi:MAG: hypothetical protein IJ840_09795 [Bacteroidales bacterium]|nr:hypothetical protein [Bacteroidales bacterium]